MTTTFGALVPVFLLVVLGHLFARRRFPGPSFFAHAETLVYRLLLPALLFLTTAGFELAHFRVLPVAAALVASVAATVLAAIALRPFAGVDDRAFSSVAQGSVRTNTYVGLAGAGALYGAAGIEVMGIVVFVVITSVNVVAVLVLARYGRPVAGQGGVAAVVRNPLIVACIAGFAVNLFGVALPHVLDETLRILARAALPLGLLCVGAGLELVRLGMARRAIALTLALKLLLMPALTALFCRLFEVEGLTAAAAILFNAVPISASSYVLARQMGGDAPLMAALITWSTIGAVFTMPVMLALLT
jgi:malonate transporter